MLFRVGSSVIGFCVGSSIIVFIGFVSSLSSFFHALMGTSLTIDKRRVTALSEHLLGLLLGHYLYHGSLRMTEADFITHHTVFHRVFERGFFQDFHFLTLDESHLNNTLAETAMTHDFHNDATLAVMQF